MRREEETLRASEAELRELADAMPQIVWTSTPDGQVDYFNDRWYELTGSTVAAGTNDLLLMTHADDQQTVIDAWQHSVATGYPCQVEHRLRVGNSGEFRWHLLRAAPVRDAEGQVRRWYGSCTDIQDQKGVEKQLRSARLDLEARVFERTAELSSAVVRLRDEVADRITAVEALRRSEERFAKAFHSSPDAIVIIRQSDFRIIEVNEKAEALFGYSRAEVLGRSYDDFGLIVQDDDRYLRRRLFEANGRLRELEADVRHKSGDVLRVVLVTDTMDMAGEACYIVIVRDITERKRADALLNEQQRELAHLSRVAALGELSGALAHELNQPLAAILSNARAAQRMIPADTQNAAEVREILEDIASDDRRAGEVISRMRTLLKKSDLQPRPVSLAEIVKEVLGLLHSDLIQRRVSVTSQVPASLPTVMGDRVQLQQVLLNLILNACDAMVQQPPTDRRLAIDAALTDEGAVQLSVRDWGVGISANRLEQIFDPFVTTKESGLGLGLAICRSIVTAHGGRLWAVNNSDRGATFRMSLTPAGIGSTVGVAAGENRVLGRVNSQERQ